MPSLILEGYAASGLIENLAKATWTSVTGGKNFTRIGMGNYALTDAPDAFLPNKYRVTVEELPPGKQFRVEGFAGTGLIEYLRSGKAAVTFDGKRLEDRTFQDLRADESAYRAVIEEVPVF